MVPADSTGPTVVDEDQVSIAEVRLSPRYFMLLEKLARSWSLARADSTGSIVVDGEQVAITEVRLSPCCFMLLLVALFLSERINFSRPLPEQ